MSSLVSEELAVEPQMSFRAAAAKPGSIRVAPVGLGSAVPDKVVYSSEIEDELGVERGWLASRTHIEERRFLVEGETHHGLGAKAARVALKDAGIEAKQLDLIICATCTAHNVTPSAAALIADEIGADHVGAFDLAAACAGFATGISTASGLIESGRFKAILVVGVDALSRFRYPHDKATAGLIADGAGAMVLRAGSEGDGGIGQIGPAVLGSDGSLADTVVISREDPHLRMRGHETYLTAVNVFTKLIQDTAAAADSTVDDYDLIVMHQANGRIIDAVKRRLGVSDDRMVNTISFHANTSAASIPLALCDVNEAGKLHRGSRVLVAGFGAGLSWAGITFVWEGSSEN